MKISARNQIGGTVLSVSSGAVNAAVKIDIGLAEGNAVTVLTKSTDMLTGK